MEALIIVGLIFAVIVLANREGSPSAVATSAQVQPARAVQVSTDVHTVIPSIAAPSQVDAPLPLTILQQQPAPGPIAYLPNPDAHNFGNFGPPPPAPSGQEPISIGVQTLTVPQAPIIQGTPESFVQPVNVTTAWQDNNLVAIKTWPDGSQTVGPL